MEPMEQEAAPNRQEEAAAQDATKPDGQAGATAMNGGEPAKSTVMREAVPKRASQGRAASSAKPSKKKTFGSVLFVIGIIVLIGSLLSAVLMLLNSVGDQAYLMMTAAFSLFLSGIFSGLVLMGLGKGLILLQELVNQTRPRGQ